MCKSVCSPDSLTTEFKPKVLFVRDVSKRARPKNATEADVATMACSKACSDGFRIQLDDGEPGATSHSIKEATVFCSTYKLVSCRWEAGRDAREEQLGAPGPDSPVSLAKAAANKATSEASEAGILDDMEKTKPTATEAESRKKRVFQPNRKVGWQTDWGVTTKGSLDSSGLFSLSSGSGGRFVCNQRKHAFFVGYQAHGDQEQPYKPNMPLYIANTANAKEIARDWVQQGNSKYRNPLTPAMGKVKTFLPSQSTLADKELFQIIMSKNSSLCAKHALLM